MPHIKNDIPVLPYLKALNDDYLYFKLFLKMSNRTLAHPESESEAGANEQAYDKSMEKI